VAGSQTCNKSATVAGGGATLRAVQGNLNEYIEPRCGHQPTTTTATMCIFGAPASGDSQSVRTFLLNAHCGR